MADLAKVAAVDTTGKLYGSPKQGLIVGKPDNHPERIAKVPGGPGAADNKFIMADVSGANINGGPHAGIEIYTSQCKFVESTS